MVDDLRKKYICIYCKDCNRDYKYCSKFDKSFSDIGNMISYAHHRGCIL